MINGAAIPFYPQSEASNPFMRVSKGTNTGSLDLINSGSGIDNLRFDHPSNSGTYYPREASYFLIDNFEDGDMSEYVERQSGSHSFVSGGLHSDSNQSVKLMNYVRYLSLPQDDLWYYPNLGDTIKFSFKVTATHGDPAFLRFDFGVQDYNTDNLYRLEWESQGTTEADWSLEKRVDGVNEIVNASNDYTGPTIGNIYTVEIFTQTSGSISTRYYGPDGSIIGSLYISDGSNQFTSGGIGLETNGNMECEFDALRIEGDRQLATP